MPTILQELDEFAAEMAKLKKDLDRHIARLDEIIEEMGPEDGARVTSHIPKTHRPSTMAPEKP